MTAYDRLPLNALRVFEAVATRLNFGEAAEALHVTPGSSQPTDQDAGGLPADSAVQA